MKKPIVLVLVLILMTAAVSPAAPQNKVVAYYFHGNARCYTCRTMEQYSKEALETNFKDALAAGKLEFKAVNVEERENEHFAQKYQLYTKSLVLSLVKDGKEIRSKNLAGIWDHVRNKRRFFDYVTEEVSDFLKEIQ
ncbi:MAG TPA: nitrophenyl compound nitroreductase subunit ArsF family protein [Candidatus Omnitrophota bacterium]|nr:nitrophenyl compound nitroreductase subunit ArsF family protein [Candidatus Omnitrophota bacterium]HRZ14765.1 nitrophenyl compound nitroreductase subunit ArsF family protein [Candidatus Omnitrophota bacterium]